MTDELKPCPFCGGEAERHTIGNDEPNNAGGDVICCTRCGASSHVEFGYKENLVSAWNTRPPAKAPDDLRPWCGTCGATVAEVLCPSCAKWWHDNPPPDDLREAVAKAMYDACLARRFEDQPERITPWPPMREVLCEWLEHADAALSVTSPRLQEAVEIITEFCMTLADDASDLDAAYSDVLRGFGSETAAVFDRARAFIERETSGE